MSYLKHFDKLISALISSLLLTFHTNRTYISMSFPSLACLRSLGNNIICIKTACYIPLMITIFMYTNITIRFLSAVSVFCKITFVDQSMCDFAFTDCRQAIIITKVLFWCSWFLQTFISAVPKFKIYTCQLIGDHHWKQLVFNSYNGSSHKYVQLKN